MMNANAKKVGWFVGAIVVVLLLSNVEAADNSSTPMVMSTSEIAPSSTTTQVVPSTSVVIIITIIRIRIYGIIRITSVNYDDVKNLTTGAGLAFKTNVERDMLAVRQQIPYIKSGVVTKVGSGSVIIYFCWVAVFYSEAEVKNTDIVKDVTGYLKTGPKIGNYTTDQDFDPKVTTMREGSTTEKPPITGASAITAMVGVVVSCLGLYYLF